MSRAALVALVAWLPALLAASEAAGQPAASAEEALRAGRWAEAEAAALAALARSPDSAAELSRLGQARLQLERFAGAQAALERAVALGRGDPATLFALGAACWENGATAAAEVAYRRALEATRRSPLALHTLGRLLVWSGRHEEAVDLLAEATGALGGEDSLLAVDLARALDAAGRADEAIAAYRATLALAPQHLEARYRLGLLLARRGELEAANREFALYEELQVAQQASLRAAGLEAARLERARAETAAGRPRVALELLAGLPETPDVLLAIALARLAAGEPEAAVAALQEAVALAPQREDLLRQLVAARLVAGGP